ncbi:hypothetical protein [Streptomyces sp. CB00455]|uniref:hypothetical protein n=1 Tax=Streptomyces sp. CB00455 TaxID=1703927 RepID=UPI000938F5C2|nr:hypothetical protein [Streptomyces sp. CB00455]
MDQTVPDFQSLWETLWPDSATPRTLLAESGLSGLAGGRDSALVRPHAGTRIRTPYKLVVLPNYCDAALSAYVKIAALARRPEGCTAGVSTLATFLNVGKSTVERGIHDLRQPDPDGFVELVGNERRTLKGGRGTTARRRIRPMEPWEPFVWIPVLASESLPPRLLRAYAVIAYGVARGLPLTVADVAAHLRHQHGPRAGMPISVEATRKIIKRLVRSGWLIVIPRAGYQGRNLYQVNDEPIPPPLAQKSETACASPQPDDGSGPQLDDGSLAYKEDTRTDRPDDKTPLPSAGGELPVVGARPQQLRSADCEDPVAVDGGALRADGSSPLARPVADRQKTPPARPDASPAFLSRTTHTVLQPAHFLLDGLRGYVLRLMGREIDRQLADGVTVERLQARITARLAGTMVSEIRDPGRWLLGVALPRWGCADPACESGVVWHTGQDCRACTEIRWLQSCDRLERPRAGARPPAPPRPCCPTCARPHRPGGEGECTTCAEERTVRARLAAGLPQAAGTDPGPPAPRCCGRNGQCTRPASLDGMCWRCLTATPERVIPSPRRRFTVQDHVPAPAAT